MLQGLENQFSVFLRVAVLHRFYCIYIYITKILVMPFRYTAVYNYKPQKTDELELRKGDFYTVFEKCQDGWFKGQCLKIGISGVFPGNYVQLCR